MATQRNCETGISSLRKKLGKKAADFVERLRSNSPIAVANDDANESHNVSKDVSAIKGRSGTNSKSQLTEPSYTH
jgi:hypothetical protein